MKFDTPRTIESGVLYQLDEFKARMGIRNAAWLALLRQGMPVIRVGRRGYVKGGDAIEFLETFKESTNG